jgi:hypothetical protein
VHGFDMRFSPNILMPAKAKKGSPCASWQRLASLSARSLVEPPNFKRRTIQRAEQ